MPDYKESRVVGNRWNRFNRVVVNNPRAAAPSVICVEEEVVSLGDAEVRRDIGNLSFAFDPSAEFPVLNPATNEPTGLTGTGAQVYALIYGYVMSEAAKRDAALVPAEAPPAIEPAPVDEPEYA